MHQVAITSGLSGFLGSNFLFNLHKKYNTVINFERGNTYKVYHRNGKIENLKKKDEIFGLFNPVVFYNFATYYNPNPKSIHDINNIVESNINFHLSVIESLNLDNIRVINLCSYLQLIKNETQNLYTLSKEFLKVSLNSLSDNVSNIYLFDTFGNKDKRNKVVDVFINSIKMGEDIMIPENEIIINISDVLDVCESIDDLKRIPLGDSCVLSPYTISLESLAKLLMDIQGKKTKIIKSGTTKNYFKLIQNFPRNIYKQHNNNDFSEKLKKRTYEIIKA